MTNSSARNNPITFPCDFTIKAMGKNNPAFISKFTDILQRHVSNFSKQQISQRLSKDANYLALSIKIRAQSQQQLDAIYQDLSRAEEILIAL